MPISSAALRRFNSYRLVQSCTAPSAHRPTQGLAEDPKLLGRFLRESRDYIKGTSISLRYRVTFLERILYS